MTLRELDAVGIQHVIGGKDEASLTALTNLTALRIRPLSGVRMQGRCPALPAAVGMKDLRLSHCDDISDVLSTIKAHMKGLTRLSLAWPGSFSRKHEAVSAELQGLLQSLGQCCASCMLTHTATQTHRTRHVLWQLLHTVVRHHCKHCVTLAFNAA